MASIAADFAHYFDLLPCLPEQWGYTGPRARLRSSYSSPLSWFILSVAPVQHCLIACCRRYRYTHPRHHYSTSNLLLLSLFWSSTWVVKDSNCLDQTLRLPHASVDASPNLATSPAIMMDVLHWSSATEDFV